MSVSAFSHSEERGAAPRERHRKNSLRRCLNIASQNHLINEEIQAAEVRLISESGEQLGIMSSQAALEKAGELEVDLVMISPQAKPPVCKLMDYGKYRFEQAKKEK